MNSAARVHGYKSELAATYLQAPFSDWGGGGGAGRTEFSGKTVALGPRCGEPALFKITRFCAVDAWRGSLPVLTSEHKCGPSVPIDL